jgi:GGDEF domain-containing protein
LDVDRLAKRLAEAFREPFTVARTTTQLGISISVACIDRQAGTKRLSAADLIQAADAAMYESKSARPSTG